MDHKHGGGKSQPAATSARRERLLALDAFRGLTILAMILVNNPGRWGDQYWPLAHAQWHGWTPTDLIFPFFLFIVGTALAYSFRKYFQGRRIAPGVYWRITRRTVALILLGLLPGVLDRLIDYWSGGSTALDFSTLRITGVLQRIAIVYFSTSLLVLFIPVRPQIALAGVLLLSYWAAMAFLPSPGDYERNLSSEGNVAGLVDRLVFTPPHMYTYNSQTGKLSEMT
jgi:predicted acyltransferase